MFSFNDFEAVILQQMKIKKVPGLALAVIKDQSVVYSRGFGVTSVEDGGAPVTSDTLFRIGSTTKPLTGTLAMRLVEEGKLSLDAPLKGYLPDLRLQDAEAEKKVTLRHLMSQTSGLPSDFKDEGSRDPQGLEKHVREDFPRYPLIAPPGKVFSYSNPGINLIGYAAEAVTGKPYAQLMNEYVFAPLEMARTTFDFTVAMTYPLALPHLLADDGSLVVQHRIIDNTAFNPSGLAFSTARDLANFAILQMNAGLFKQKRLLSSSSIEEMQRIQAPIYSLAQHSGVESYQKSGYGLTFFTAEAGKYRWVNHTGGIQSYLVFFEMVPHERAACILLANGGSNSLDAGAIFDPIYTGLFGIQAPAANLSGVDPERGLWKRLEGMYRGENGLVKVEQHGQQLAANINGEEIALEALSRNFYFGKSSAAGKKYRSVGFILEDNGPVEYLVAEGNIFKRDDRFSLAQLEAAQLEKLTGLFHNGIHGDFEVTQNDGRLALRLVKLERSEPYIALDAVHFTGSFGPLVFDVDESGVARSFRINDAFTFERIEAVKEE